MGFIVNDPTFYQELKWSVVSAFKKLGYIKIPVDPSELFEAHGIQSLAYQSIYDSSSLRDLVMLCRCPSGFSFTLTTRGGCQRFVACNLQESPGRVRFTKLHEAGHLLRGHVQGSETAEIEANFWAKYSIAPPVLVETLGLSSVEETARRFGISTECASHIMSQHSNWLRHRQDDKDIDDAILELYHNGLLLERRNDEQTELTQIMK